MKKALFVSLAILSLVSWKSFSTQQKGVAMTMKMTSSNNINATIVIYYDTPGTRVEMNATTPSGFSFSNVSIVKANQPDTVYQPDDKTKTYTLVDVSNAETDKDNEPATATLIGNDSVNGYKCLHVKVVQGAKNWEIWTTKSITEFFKYSAVINKQRYIGNHGVQDALKSVNAEGFPVRTILTDKDGTHTTDLVSVENKILDPTLFTIPADYKKTDHPAGFPGMPQGMPTHPH